eukprot:7665539-Heterocapsa_arctica.AAC.1
MRKSDIRKVHGLHQQWNGLRKRDIIVQAGDLGHNESSHRREHSRTGLQLHKQRGRGADRYARHHQLDGDRIERAQNIQFQAQGKRTTH